jgi:hypothetical protein
LLAITTTFDNRSKPNERANINSSPIEWPEEMARKYREVVDEERQQESNPVATGKSPMIGVRMNEEMQDLINNPAAEQNDHPSLSGAIRSLVERGLKAKKLRNLSYQSG